jgi:hypothetical protein
VRTLEILGLAAEAEVERWKLQALRQARRAVLFGIGGIMAVAALAMLNLCAWLALARLLGPVWAAAAVAAGDLLLALIFFAIASSNRRGAAEVEALALRMQALTAARNSLPLLTAAVTVISALRGRSRRR